MDNFATPSVFHQGSRDLQFKKICSRVLLEAILSWKILYMRTKFRIENNKNYL